MDYEWKEWDVVEDMRKIKVPGFMFDSASSAFDVDGIEARIQREWGWFVELLNTNGDGTGYERLLTLQDNMKARKETLSRRLEKWEDREDRLGKLKGHYQHKLQDLAGVGNPRPIRRTHGVNDPVEQLPDAVNPLADQPIVEAFVDFDEDGRLVEQPELEGGWTAYIKNVSVGWLSDSAEGFVAQGPEPHRENMTIRYQLSNGELERAGIDPNNLGSHLAIQMKPSTTWREALSQIEEREQDMKEKKERPKRTLRVLGFRVDILENVLYRFEAFGSSQRLTETDAQEMVDESKPGRRTTLKDPTTHPGLTLKAVLEWVGDDTNRDKPFRSKNQSSLCGFVSERLEEEVGFQVPQDTIKTRLQALMSQLGIELPHGHTNTQSYFEAREEIAEAIKEHDLV